MMSIHEDPARGLLLAERDHPVSVAVWSGEAESVRRAVMSLVEDVTRVCGCQAQVSEINEGSRIVVATAGSPLAPAGSQLPELRKSDGSLRRESFVIEADQNAVYLIGADARGAIYAVYELAQAIGVSPWHWFADVPVVKRQRIVVEPGRYADWPSVAHRGIFINDEEELDQWARRHTADEMIGPELYEHVFDLVLRLKGNYVWPAMHVNAFHANPDNARLATAMGIIIGTSHCDILGRNNVHEWQTWVDECGEPVAYDASLMGRNRQLLLDYWRKRVEQCTGFEMTWTLGMRGIHDSALNASAIDPAMSESERLDAEVALLGGLIRDQRALLTEANRGGGGCDRQIFIMYKEVMDLCDRGLCIPDDVTIVWPDDNFGHMRRYPGPIDVGRGGGHGLYYHCSYWSMPPRTYLFVGSTPLTQMALELQTAWDKGIRELWVDNVGPIKRRELEMDFFLRMAWSVGKEPVSASSFLLDWMNRTFSGNRGNDLADVWKVFEAANTRKVEHLTTGAFSQTAYGDEAGRRILMLKRVCETIRCMGTSLAPRERSAFFQLIGLKTEAAYLMGAEFYYADRSLLAYDRGKRAAASQCIAMSRRCSDKLMAAIAYYNETMSGGKWSGVLSPQEFPPPRMPMGPRGQPGLEAGVSGVGVAVWGEEPRRDSALRFDPYGVASKWIEIFALGGQPVPFEIEADSWIRLDVQGGTVADERRIAVGLDRPSPWTAASGWITVSSGGDVTRVRVEVSPPVTLPEGFCGAVEADGSVSMDAEWGGGGCGSQVYPFVLTTPGAHRLEIYRYPALNSGGRIRALLAIDDEAAVVLESATTDEYRGQWENVVRDHVETLTFDLPYLDAGAHRVTLKPLEDCFRAVKLVIHTHYRWTALGPPLSHHTTYWRDQGSDPSPASFIDSSHDPWIAAAPWVPPVRWVDRAFWAGGDPMFAQPARHRHQVDQTVIPVAFEAELALMETSGAWTAPSKWGERWLHTQAETSGRMGLAMVALGERPWEDPLAAPTLRYRIQVPATGTYHVWLLVKFSAQDDDSCWVGVDGHVQPIAEQYSGGDLYTFGTQELWHWTHLSDLVFTAGSRIFSIHARKPGLRIDRVYLTLTDEYPPDDLDFRSTPL